MNIYPAIKSNVESWDIIVMGHLRVNTYWDSFDIVIPGHDNLIVL
jgi:hypothetical protein